MNNPDNILNDEGDEKMFVNGDPRAAQLSEVEENKERREEEHQ